LERICGLVSGGETPDAKEQSAMAEAAQRAAADQTEKCCLTKRIQIWRNYAGLWKIREI
jgi:hypothetical protein